MESDHRAQDPRTYFKSLGGGGVEGRGLVPDTVGFGVLDVLKLVLASSGQALGPGWSLARACPAVGGLDLQAV